MIQFEAYGKTVSLKTTWSEITIRQAGEIIAMVKSDLPKVVQRIYTLRMSEKSEKNDSELGNLFESITDDMEIKILPTFYGKVIKHLSDIDDETLNKMNRLERSVLYQRYLEGIVMGLMSVPNFEPTGIKHFDFMGERYYLPESVEGYGVDVPMGNTTAVEFIESADIELRAKGMAKGRWDQAALMIAILCRPKGETYDENKARERAKIFEGLALDVTLEVFFCFTESLTTSEHIGLTYLKDQGSPVSGRGSTDGRRERSP